MTERSAYGILLDRFMDERDLRPLHVAIATGMSIEEIDQIRSGEVPVPPGLTKLINDFYSMDDYILEIMVDSEQEETLAMRICAHLFVEERLSPKEKEEKRRFMSKIMAERECEDV